MNPYEKLVADYARLIKQGKKLPLGGFAPAPRPKLKPDAPKALIFSPHPDDECIIGALPLRLTREAGMKVVNVAVTLGSKKARRAARYRELEAACRHIGFGLVPAAKKGLENIRLKTRARDRASWSRAVKAVAGIINEQQPRIIFAPHERDWHETHVGTHFLVMDALGLMPGGFKCFVVETEFWGAMDTPNLMIESSVRDVADLVTALTFHVGEVRRDPYHLLLPAWMQDNVRRGAELVGGAGSAAPDFVFATLYRLSRWSRGELKVVPGDGRQVAKWQKVDKLFG